MLLFLLPLLPDSLLPPLLTVQMLSGFKNLLHISPQTKQSKTTPPSSNSTTPSRKSKDLPRAAVMDDDLASSVPYSAAQSTPAPPPSSSIPIAAVPAPAGSKEQAEALIRRENEARAKRERAPYAGLPEGVVLGIKMGDGAFSNVFQATLKPNAAQLAIDPTLGESVKVAVKCVRKYELSHSQVRTTFTWGTGVRFALGGGAEGAEGTGASRQEIPRHRHWRTTSKGSQSQPHSTRCPCQRSTLSYRSPEP